MAFFSTIIPTKKWIQLLKGLLVKGPSDEFKFVTGTELVIDGGWLDFLINLSFVQDKKYI